MVDSCFEPRITGFSIVTYDELASLLDVEGLEETPSEIHGLLSGRIAVGERLAGDKLRCAFLDCFDSEEELVDNAFPQLESLYQEIVANFENPDLTFQPLLPSDRVGLQDRVLALADWCQCFLSGLGSAGLTDTSGLSGEAMGAIKDLAAIAQVTFEGEPEDDDESDLFELAEYVRMAAMMIFAELNLASAMYKPETHTLH